MAKRKALEPPPVSLEVWRELYLRARNFQELAPWEWMDDTDILGIGDVHGARLVCVLGAIQEVFGCCCYRGSIGADYLMKLMRGELRTDGPEAAFGQRALLVDFVPRSSLRKQDKALLAQLGYQPVRSKPRRFPEFYSHEPGYLPWFIDEQEARMLAGDLEKVTAFAQLMEAEPEGYDLQSPDTFPFFPEKLEGSLTWDRLEWRTVSVSPAEPKSIELASLDLSALANLPQRPGTLWELSAEYSNGAIWEPPRPYWPKLALGIDGASGMVLGFQLHGADKSLEMTAADCLVQCLQACGTRPADIAVASTALAPALAPVLASLGIRLLETDRLPMTEEARASFAAFNRAF